MAKNVPAMHLVAHGKSSILYGRSYGRKSKFFSAWWVTTILYNYGATLHRWKEIKIRSINSAANYHENQFFQLETVSSTN